MPRGKAVGWKRAFSITLLLAAQLTSSLSEAAELHIATASNFRDAMKVLAGRYEEETGDSVVLIFGSTGKHYAQIRNGAPFDAFFAADSERPARLESDGLAVPGSRFTYAVGRLVLWSPRAGYVDAAGRVLEEGDFHHIAIANPGLAPYGKAAMQALQSLDLWEKLGPLIVRGENIGQAYQFVRTGNAELGLLAQSQLIRDDLAPEGSWWLVPGNLHQPIDQQAVLLSDNAPARAFMSFFRREAATRLIRAHGYETP